MINGLMLLTPLLFSSSAHAQGSDGLEWTWAEGDHQRYYIDVEVHLPTPMMLKSEFNRQARVVSYQIELVLDCSPVAERGRRRVEVACDIEEISLVGATMVGDRGRLGEVLVEVDERLTGAQIQLITTRDGRITNMDLEGVRKQNRRTATNAETLRLMLARAVAGMDMSLPRGGSTEDGVWGQAGGMLLEAPYRSGSQGSGEMVHRIKRIDDLGIVIETAGRGIVAPADDSATGPSNLYSTTLEATARFADGHLLQRRWTAIGEPTASSAIAVAGDGMPYMQAGQLVALSADEPAPTMRDTAEKAAPGDSPTSIEGWDPIPSLESR